MKHLPVLAGLALIALTSCSDGDADDAGTASTSVVTTEPSAETTTAADTTPVTDALPAQVAEAQRLAGTYSGQWMNTTFGSTGSITAEVTVDAANATATITLDIGGNAFGAADPEPFVTEIDLTQEGPISATNSMFGDFTMSMDANGHLTFEAAAVPGVNGRAMTIEGDFVGDVFSGTYSITGLAEGTFSATRS